jgi:phosphoribosyl-ATP pyrophosphohydrolase
MADSGDIQVLERVFAIIESRKGADPKTSYVAKQFANGRGKIAQKVGEEAVETVIAAMEDDHGEVVYESADLLFQLMVLWAETGVKPAEVFAELERREGVSGLDDITARKAAKQAHRDSKA